MLTVACSVEPIESEVDDYEGQEPHPQAIPWKVDYSILFVDMGVKDDIECWQNDLGLFHENALSSRSDGISDMK